MKIILSLLFFISSSISYSLEITCAIATGFPPFQFVEKEKPTGIDPELIEVFSKLSQLKINIYQENWSQVLSKFNFTDDFQCIWGIEKTPEREERFIFTNKIYNRISTLFVLENSNIKSISQLKGSLIGSDENSSLNKELSRKGLRFRKFKSKEESIIALSNGEIAAAIMPQQVGNFLSRKFKIQSKEIYYSLESTPVSIAFKKKDEQTMKKFNSILSDPKTSYEFKKILEKWAH